jgi:hypothetical protein
LVERFSLENFAYGKPHHEFEFQRFREFVVSAVVNYLELKLLVAISWLNVEARAQDARLAEGEGAPT